MITRKKEVPSIVNKIGTFDVRSLRFSSFKNLIIQVEKDLNQAPDHLKKLTLALLDLNPTVRKSNLNLDDFRDFKFSESFIEPNYQRKRESEFFEKYPFMKKVNKRYILFYLLFIFQYMNLFI